MDNPPPKIVQGYKFNIFYPDLIDKSKTPEYTLVRRLLRNGGFSYLVSHGVMLCCVCVNADVLTMSCRTSLFCFRIRVMLMWFLFMFAYICCRFVLALSTFRSVLV